MPWEIDYHHWPDDRAYAFIFSDDPLPPSGNWFIWHHKHLEWIFPQPYVTVTPPVNNIYIRDIYWMRWVGGDISLQTIWYLSECF